MIVGDGLVEIAQLLSWAIMEVEKTEMEKEGKDWPITELVSLMLINYWTIVFI